MIKFLSTKNTNQEENGFVWNMNSIDWKKCKIIKIKYS